MPSFPAARPRRLRRTPWMRRLVRETTPTVDDLIWAVIVSDTVSGRQPIPSLPGVERIGLDEVPAVAEEAAALGIPALAVFPHVDPGKKDRTGSEVLNLYGVICAAVRAIKETTPDVGVITDVALDPFTDHGHDGVLRDGVVVNDETVEFLVRAAIAQAEAGADVIAPSDMMDGRIAAIRTGLENAGHQDVALMSYAAKYASAFYGPYRDAIGSAAALEGDKSTYQMDPGNGREAGREIALDLEEGADMVLVKPGLPYLDVIRDTVRDFNVPTFAFQVSGEFAMIAAAAENQWIDGERAAIETMMCFKRAGAAGVVTYFAPWLARLLPTGHRPQVSPAPAEPEA